MPELSSDWRRNRVAEGGKAAEGSQQGDCSAYERPGAWRPGHASQRRRPRPRWRPGHALQPLARPALSQGSPWLSSQHTSHTVAVPAMLPGQIFDSPWLTSQHTSQISGSACNAPWACIQRRSPSCPFHLARGTRRNGHIVRVAAG